MHIAIWYKLYLFCNSSVFADMKYFIGWYENKSAKVGTVIPWLMRCLWQPEDRVKQNLRYMSHSSIAKKNVRKIYLSLLLLYCKTVIWEFFDIFWSTSLAEGWLYSSEIKAYSISFLGIECKFSKMRGKKSLTRFTKQEQCTTLIFIQVFCIQDI